MDYYEKLRSKLDLFPIGMPKSEETTKLLGMLFDEHEIRLAAHVPMPPLMLPARRIAAAAGLNRIDSARMLSGFAARGLIMEIAVLGEKRYCLLPAVPGMFELQFMSGQRIDDKKREAGKLWHQLMEKGPLGEESYGYKTSGVRVVPIRKAVEHTQRVYSYEEAEQLVKKSGAVAVTECACRKSAEKCDAPLDVCMIFGQSAGYLIDKNLAWRVNERGALKTLERAEDAGLVHTATNCVPPISILCNCCSCCCASLKGVTLLGKPASTVSSNFECRIVNSGADCIECGRCVEACPMDALSLGGDGISIESEKCIGCGVCVHKCRTGSLALMRKTDISPPRSSFVLASRLVMERNKGPKIIKTIASEILG